MKEGTFKTFMTVNDEFATVAMGGIITGDIPVITFDNNTTREAAEMFFSKELLRDLKIVTVTYKVEENEQ
jgi:hypothetical protein